MTATIVRRILTAVPTVLAATVLVFALRYLLPGGPVQTILGPGAAGNVTDAQIAAIEHRFGLDRPVIVQYFSWLGDLLHGDFGISYYSHQPVSTIIWQRVIPSVELILGSLLVAIVVGGTLGLFAAIRGEGRANRLISLVTGLGLAVPDFWLAAVAAGLLGRTLGILPAVGFTPITEGVGRNIHTLILPVCVLGLVTGCFLARHVESSMSAVLRQPYVRTAWAMGLRGRTVYLNWALRNALAPVITFIPIAIATLVGGTVLVENIFAIPGLGTEIVRSVESEDFPVVQAIVLCVAVVVAALNLVSDLTMAALDPRIRKNIG